MNKLCNIIPLLLEIKHIKKVVTFLKGMTTFIRFVSDKNKLMFRFEKACTILMPLLSDSLL